jgi:hypothetical protein
MEHGHLIPCSFRLALLRILSRIYPTLTIPPQIVLKIYFNIIVSPTLIFFI